MEICQGKNGTKNICSKTCVNTKSNVLLPGEIAAIQGAPACTHITDTCRCQCCSRRKGRKRRESWVPGFPGTCSRASDTGPDRKQYMSCKSDGTYNAYMEKLHRVNIKANAKENKCFVGVKDGEIVSAALIQDPAKKKADVEDYVKAGGLSLVFPVERRLDRSVRCCYTEHGSYRGGCAV